MAAKCPINPTFDAPPHVKIMLRLSASFPHIGNIPTSALTVSYHLSGFVEAYIQAIEYYRSSMTPSKVRRAREDRYIFLM